MYILYNLINVKRNIHGIEMGDLGGVLDKLGSFSERKVNFRVFTESLAV